MRRLNNILCSLFANAGQTMNQAGGNRRAEVRKTRAGTHRQRQLPLCGLILLVAGTIALSLGGCAKTAQIPAAIASPVPAKLDALALFVADVTDITVASGATAIVTVSAVNGTGATYGITSQALSTAAATQLTNFAIDGTTGVITIAAPLIFSSVYNLTVQATVDTDMVDDSFTITTGPPAGPLALSISTITDITITPSATTITTARATNIDATTAYSITSQALSTAATTQLTSFAIDSTTGVITVASLLAFSATYNLTVQAIVGTEMADTSFTITTEASSGELSLLPIANVLNVPLTPSTTAIVTAMVTNGDVTTTYSIVTQERGRTQVMLFAIDSTTGDITVIAPLASSATYIIRIGAIGNGTASIELTVMAQGGETLSLSIANVTNVAVAPSTTTVATATAMNNDGITTYALVSQTRSTDTATQLNSFAINRTTGAITVVAPLSFSATYNLTVQATRGTDMADANFTVTTRAPSAPLSLVIADVTGADYGAANTDAITTVMATNTFGITTYRITSQTLSTANTTQLTSFVINSTTGVITLASDINRSATYNLTVRATRDTDTADDSFTVTTVALGTGDIRLIGGSETSTTIVGRVEFYYKDQWGTVCGRSWHAVDAQVVCRQLGHMTTGAVAYRDIGFSTSSSRGDKYTIGTGLIFLNSVECIGTEATLASCPRGPRGGNIAIGVHNCRLDHSEDAGVMCTK